MDNLITWETLTIFVMMFPFIIITISFLILCTLKYCVKLARRCVKTYINYKKTMEAIR